MIIISDNNVAAKNHLSRSVLLFNFELVSKPLSTPFFPNEILYLFFFSFLFLFSIWKILVTTQLCIKAPYLMKIFILITKISLESQTFIQLKNINLTPLYNFFIRRTVFWRNSDPNNSNNYIVQFQISMPIITSYRNITL